MDFCERPLKKDINNEISNWERRIREQTKHYTDFLRPISEYKRRIKMCQKEIAVIDEELRVKGGKVG